MWYSKGSGVKEVDSSGMIKEKGSMSVSKEAGGRVNGEPLISLCILPSE